MLRVPAQSAAQVPAKMPRTAGVFATGIVAILAAVPVVGAVTMFGRANSVGTVAAETERIAPGAFGATLTVEDASTDPRPSGALKTLDPPARDDADEPLR